MLRMGNSDTESEAGSGVADGPHAAKQKTATRPATKSNLAFTVFITFPRSVLTGPFTA